MKRLTTEQREEMQARVAASKLDPKARKTFLDVLWKTANHEKARTEAGISWAEAYGILLDKPRRPSWSTKAKAEARALPRETRQAVLDRFHAGGVTLGAIEAELGLTLGQVVGTLALASKKVTYTVIEREAK